MPTRLVINIRGANGAGKTTLARGVLAHRTADLEPFQYTSHGNKERKPRPRLWPVARCGKMASVPIALCKVPGLELPVYVMGVYDQSKYSGCDKVKSSSAISDAVWHATHEIPCPGHLLFEGFRVSKSYNRYVELAQRIAREVPDARFVWAGIRVSLTTVVRRIMERAEPGHTVNLPEITSVVRAQDGQRRKARWVVNPSPVLELDGEAEPEAIFQQLVAAMAHMEREPAR